MQRIVLVGILAVIGSLVAFGCERDRIDDTMGVTTIRGTVRDASSDTPIESAMIMINDSTANDTVYADSAGNYLTYGLSWGDHYRLTFKVICRKAGYRTKVDSVYSTPENRTFDSTNFQLTAE